MHGSISIENIKFSRNCDIKTTCEERHGRFCFGKDITTKIISNTFEIEHSLLSSRVAIFRRGWGSHIGPIHHRSTDVTDKPNS